MSQSPDPLAMVNLRTGLIMRSKKVAQIGETALLRSSSNQHGVAVSRVTVGHYCS